jgi:4-aminobutyrate aminotransferase-like enzyme
LRVDRSGCQKKYFSTFGGNPVSCAATLTVLDVIEETGLVKHSGAIGEELRAGLTVLTRDLGFGVRGQGLFAGVAIDPEAVPGLSAAVMAERLRRRGVLVGTTGPGGHVLKIRPPLVWEREHVEVFLDAFASALG